MRRLLILLAVPFALAGCPSNEDPCTPESQKAQARDMMRSWYLYPDLMQSVDPGDPAYPTVSEYLAAMTAPARAAGKEKEGWTYATSLASTQAYFDAGASVGFGYQNLVRHTPAGNLLFIAQVFPNTAAAGAGFTRGDQILAIGETEATLVDVPQQLAEAEVSAWAAQAVGPATAGLTRTYRVLTLAGDTVVRTMTKRAYTLEPVANGAGAIPGTNVGYVALRTFISPAEPVLTSVFQNFKANGVQDVIVDLRYNGGGLVSTAEVLSNLLAGDLTTTDLMYRFQNNPAHASLDEQTFFAPTSDAIGTPGTPFRIAFIMTKGASASASELVANVLEPYHEQEIAIVGSQSYGKPVGQRGFGVSACDLAVYLISFRLVNSQGEGDYYQGLPDANGSFNGPLCAATDDLTLAPGDPDESSTAAALSWLSTGSCPPAPAAAATKLSARTAAKLATAPDTYPAAIAPDEAQRNIPGLF